MSKEMWIIEPRDPLIVRDGRPFGATPGARAKTLPFPFPSTVAGGIRTRAGQDENGRFDKGKIDDVKGIETRGPLLAQIGENGQVSYLVPAPNDALLMTPNGKTPDAPEADLRPLVPLTHPDMATELPEPLQYPVGLEEVDLKKPAKNAPAFWHWHTFCDWLLAPSPIENVQKGELGVGHFPTNDRSHVKIDASTLTGEDGALFATSGLEFRFAAHGLDASRQYGLAVEVDMKDGLPIDSGIAPLGGERRMMHWFKVQDGLPPAPKGLADKLTNQKACRLFLLTPAYFDEGWKPTRLLQSFNGLTLTLKASAVGKPVTVSGWDFEKRLPKKTRRLAPAGSVYFVQFGGDLSQIPAWLEAIWMQTRSDDEAFASSGFGLTAVGVWDGSARELTVKEGSDA